LDRHACPLARTSVVRLAILALVLLAPSPVRAQTGWRPTLFTDPFPPPYLSDWEINPNISTLTVVNTTGVTQTVTAVYRVANQAGRVLASGRSDPQTVPANVPQFYTSFVDIAGTSSHDVATEAEMQRTGRLPEGTYRACVAVMDGNGFVVAEACADFTIVYPDPPLLIAPSNGELVRTTAPFLQWTPMQVPAEFQLRYILQIAEVLPAQLPDEALNGPVPHYLNPDVGTTNLQYPLDAPPLVEGRTYAWRVVALDQNGYAAAANGGASETQVFRYDPGAGASPGSSAITLSLHNAFDADDGTGTAAGVRSAPGATADIDQLCALWDDPPDEYVITSDSPLGMRRLAGQDAELYQNDTSRDWWIVTRSPNGKRDVLIGGGCTRGDNTVVHWIASKNETLQQRISAFLSNPFLHALPGPNVENVNFSMVVLAKGGSFTVEVPDEFAAGVAFLGGREFDVATGLNLYSEIDLEEFALWPLFQEIGFTEKRITISGFLGWDASWSLGGTIGSDPGQVDVSTEHKYLVLRAALPKRTPNGLLAGKVQSMGFELEISVGDSTGRAWKKGSGPKPDVERSLEIIPKLLHVIEVNDNLTLEGSLALDFARKTTVPELVKQRLGYVTGFLGKPEELDVDTDVIISYGAEGTLNLGPRGNVHLDAVTLDVKFPFYTPRFKQEFMLAGEFGVGGVDGLVKVGIAFRRINLQALHTALGDARKKRYEASTKLTASETGECTKGASVSTEKSKWCALDAQVKSIEQELDAHKAFPDPSKKKSEWDWKLRASAGHLSLGALLGLLREGGP
jgi:hypothetical protein